MPSVLGTNALAKVAGLLRDFFEKVSGSDGEMWVQAFGRFLRKENPWASFPTWKTIRLGTHQNLEALKSILTDAGFRITGWANDIMGKNVFTIASEETSIDLVTATVAELGFTGSTGYDAICTRIRELGYDLCPNEVGPQLRLQYKDQPKGEWLLVAMEPIADSSGNRSHLFCVEHTDSGELWLDADGGLRGLPWRAAVRVVFARRTVSVSQVIA